MVNKISPVSCIADFNSRNKQFKKYITKEVQLIKNNISFEEILRQAKEKLK